MYKNIKNKLSFLKEIFNYNSFRYGQDIIIDSIVEDKKNNLVIIPTGGGKSLIYQISGCLIKNRNKNKGLTLVISPLISLMQDQVKELNMRGIKGYEINSNSSNIDKLKIFKELKDDKVDFLFISPEKLGSNKMLNFLKSLKINLFVIDEAHCCSLWGHQFRPDYSKIGENINKINNNPLILALTATANKQTINDIKNIIFNNDNNLQITIGGYYRDNFEFNIINDFNTEKNIYNIVNENISNNKNGIIYFSTIKELENFTKNIFRKEITNGIASYYHGKMDTKLREKIQNDFLNGKYKFILATNAFGMGINKLDIDFIIHNGYPSDIESYYQEIGRGGRDGRPVKAYMVKQNLKTQIFFIEISFLSSSMLNKIIINLKNNFIKKGKKTISYNDITELSESVLGNIQYLNGTYSYLIKFGYINKNEYGEYDIDEKNLNNDIRNLNIYKEIDLLRIEKLKNINNMFNFFDNTSLKTIQTIKKYINNNENILEHIENGIYFNILDFFNDNDGIKKLINNKKIFDINKYDYSDIFKLKNNLKFCGYNKELEIIEKKLKEDDYNDYIIGKLEDKEEKDKNILINERISFF